MPSAPISAPPDVMALLCLIGRVMRGMEASRLGMRLLVVGALCPSFGRVMRTWMEVEAHVARAPEADDPWWGVDRDEDEGRSGWISRTGMVWRWRQVTRAGARVMLVRWFEAQPHPAWLRPGEVWAPVWSIAPLVGRAVFSGVRGLGGGLV